MNGGRPRNTNKHRRKNHGGSNSYLNPSARSFIPQDDGRNNPIDGISNEHDQQAQPSSSTQHRQPSSSSTQVYDRNNGSNYNRISGNVRYQQNENRNLPRQNFNNNSNSNRYNNYDNKRPNSYDNNRPNNYDYRQNNYSINNRSSKDVNRRNNAHHSESPERRFHQDERHEFRGSNRRNSPSSRTDYDRGLNRRNSPSSRTDYDRGFNRRNSPQSRYLNGDSHHSKSPERRYQDERSNYRGSNRGNSPSSRSDYDRGSNRRNSPPSRNESFDYHNNHEESRTQDSNSIHFNKNRNNSRYSNRENIPNNNFNSSNSYQQNRNDGRHNRNYNDRNQRFNKNHNEHESIRRNYSSDNNFDNNHDNHSSNHSGPNNEMIDSGPGNSRNNIRNDQNKNNQNQNNFRDRSNYENQNENSFSVGRTNRYQSNYDRTDKRNTYRHRNENDTNRSRTPENKDLNNSDSYQDEKVKSQRDKLIQILLKGTQECLVCCERIAQAQSIWSCNKCYNVLHLACTKKWASSSTTENGWRCPACQNVSIEVPQLYQCFCKKQILDIGWNHTDTPHSCGEVCNKDLSRNKNVCGHRCTLLCHPGPCPICEIVVTKYCGCGNTNCKMQCGSNEILTCDSICNKLLNCGQHKCEKKCHKGECQPCTNVITQVCFCKAHNKETVCDKDVELFYTCGEMCKKQLECGHHTCTSDCHPGPCDLCYLIPEFITTCCCGKTPLTDNNKRQSCIDPIPTCSLECGKTLHCGELEEKHKCKDVCHEGDCPPCKLTSIVLCDCKQRKRQIQCKDLKPGIPVKCNIKCSALRICGKHKCNQNCCTSQDHICPLKCNRKLRCGNHKCELLCHHGQCLPCPNVSFEELSCRCGAEVIFPPVACGTKRPICRRICNRQHSCNHQPLHECHDDPECPQCVVFTEKWCFGHHQMRKNIFCYLESYSCGQACGKILKCHRHTCITPCHEGDCLKTNEKCTQLCTKPRTSCGHPCNEICHPGSCPGSACKVRMQVSCNCGERSETHACIEDQSIVEQFNKNSKGQYKILECDDNCALIERNRRLALGLQIRNPDLNLKLKPMYPDVLKQWGKKDPDFCNHVHTKLADLVKLAKESKQKSRSFSFEVMNRDKRQFVHAYAEFFGIEAEDCDPEPKRNVLVTAHKDKAWLPGYSLMETIHREKGQPKVSVIPSNKEISGNKNSRVEMVQLGKKS